MISFEIKIMSKFSYFLRVRSYLCQELNLGLVSFVMCKLKFVAAVGWRMGGIQKRES